MEPPPKRLRILQSVEVDEENADYIDAKQKQQKKFKGRLESIFAKYESMHESMSDVIDMKENKVVVDRGHLRRLVRQAHRKETILLDTFGMAAGEEEEEPSEDEEGHEDSEDELAPTQRPKSGSDCIKPGKEGQQTIAHNDSNQPSAQLLTTPANTKTGAQQIPYTPNPAANLLQLVHFPQTPEGQQAQTAFYATLTQTINHAVQQAVAPLFSGLLPNAPNVQIPIAQALPAPGTPVTAGDKIVPATDPKWYLPPLSVESRKPGLVQSSPGAICIEPVTSNAADDQVMENDAPVMETANMEGHSIEVTEPSPQPFSAGLKDTSDVPPRHRHPRAEIQRRKRRPPAKYHFADEDDIYISKSRKLHNLTWLEIRDSRDKWRSWPVWVLQHRWCHHLKDKNLHLTEPTADSPDEHHAKRVSNQYSPIRSYHLPTPSSLRYDDRVEQAKGWKETERHNALSSSTAHYDDEELELLSLPDVHHGGKQRVSRWNDAYIRHFTPKDSVLPSVEIAESVDEENLQEEILEDSPTEKPVSVIAISNANSTTKAVPSTPRRKRKRQSLPTHSQVVPDSGADEDEDNLETMGAGQTAKILQANSRPTHHTVRNSSSLDLVGDDDLQAPITPRIKRESSTPLPTAFQFSTPALQTPNMSSEQFGRPSSRSKSTSKLGRKAYLKQVKQSWTKKATPGPRSVAKRKSFPTLPRKRAWPGGDQGGEDSEDELAL